MTRKKIVNIDYDPGADILYICLVPGVPSYADEEITGVLIRKSIENDEITGVTILDLKKRLINKTLMNISLPIVIDLERVGKELLTTQQ